MMAWVGLLDPARRCSRSRRTMFSMSMIASSTTTPIAMMNPASTIVFTVAPRTAKTSAAATSDSGMATIEISAERHSNRKKASTSATSSRLSSSERFRLASESSM
ncbi:hypothetical protein HRbin26_02439 [bacterium HR26]|nr:hypothetical protein HRbin26_02439 [bacterium HR26]